MYRSLYKNLLPHIHCTILHPYTWYLYPNVTNSLQHCQYITLQQSVINSNIHTLFVLCTGLLYISQFTFPIHKPIRFSYTSANLLFLYISQSAFPIHQPIRFSYTSANPLPDTILQVLSTCKSSATPKILGLSSMVKHLAYNHSAAVFIIEMSIVL